MKKRFTFFAFLFSFSLFAQLPDGSPAPDWTMTDIDGNEWNLHEILAEGKAVLLEFTATWSDDIWEYHESGALSEFYAQYGPDGSDEAMVFFMESDEETTLQDISGSGGNTVGNWLDNTAYPIIDGAENIAEEYDIGDLSLLLICPNRLLENVGFESTFSLYSASQNCLVPAGENNAGIYLYVGFQGEFCEERTFAPSVIWQNIGSENITSATFELYVNNALEQVIPWSGNLEPFAIDPQAFDAVTVDETTAFDILISEVNGGPDANDADNLWELEATEAPIVDQNFLTLEIFTDEYPTETYWEIVDENGVVFHAGGNPGIFDDTEQPGAYTEPATSYETEVPIPLDGCYEFVIYDQFGDGICCDYGLGYYRLKNENNIILLQGGLFAGEERRPFSLVGSPGILDNAQLLTYSGPQGDFCGTLEFQPELTVANLGGNVIQSIEIEVTDVLGELVLSFTHSTNLALGGEETFPLDPISVEGSDLYRYRIVNVNGVPDAVASGNQVLVKYDNRPVTTPPLSLDIQTDEWGYELYWEMRTPNGKIIASGGNDIVGPNGGGLQVATEDDPGAYPQFELITEQFSLPAGADDCFEFVIVDDWGDGLSGGGFFKLTTEAGDVILNTPFTTNGVTELYLIDGQLAPSSVENISELNQISIAPNPVNGLLKINFSISESRELFFGIYDALGREVYFINGKKYGAGAHNFEINMGDSNSGIYFLRGYGEGVEFMERVMKE